MILDTIKNIKYINSGNFFLIAGPCVIEDEEITYKIAKRVSEITDNLKIPFIFKASYKKANRTRIDSFKGIGDTEAMNILKKTGDTLSLPVITDIHAADEAAVAAEYADILQIPAFLCRQTELLAAAAKTDRVIVIKKGQFASADTMEYAAKKISGNGNNKIMLTERGNFFGYQDLVVDFRNITKMKKLGYPVILDITHSLQQPNLEAGVSGGIPEMIETLACAGIATGVDGIFIETHPDPAKAKSDGTNMLHLDKLGKLLEKLVKLRKAVNSL